MVPNKIIERSKAIDVLCSGLFQSSFECLFPLMISATSRCAQLNSREVLLLLLASDSRTKKLQTCSRVLHFTTRLVLFVNYMGHTEFKKQNSSLLWSIIRSSCAYKIMFLSHSNIDEETPCMRIKSPTKN
jgi:hypothetical protein